MRGMRRRWWRCDWRRSCGYFECANRCTFRACSAGRRKLKEPEFGNDGRVSFFIRFSPVFRMTRSGAEPIINRPAFLHEIHLLSLYDFIVARCTCADVRLGSFLGGRHSIREPRRSQWLQRFRASLCVDDNCLCGCHRWSRVWRGRAASARTLAAGASFCLHGESYHGGLWNLRGLDMARRNPCCPVGGQGSLSCSISS